MYMYVLEGSLPLQPQIETLFPFFFLRKRWFLISTHPRYVSDKDMAPCYGVLNHNNVNNIMCSKVWMLDSELQHGFRSAD